MKVCIRSVICSVLLCFGECRFYLYPIRPLQLYTFQTKWRKWTIWFNDQPNTLKADYMVAKNIPPIRDIIKYRYNAQHENSTPITQEEFIDGLVQDCSNPIANALELLKSCAKPSIYHYKTSDAASIPRGLVQDCSNSIANALDLLHSCTKQGWESIVFRRNW